MISRRLEEIAIRLEAFVIRLEAIAMISLSLVLFCSLEWQADDRSFQGDILHQMSDAWTDPSAMSEPVLAIGDMKGDEKLDRRLKSNPFLFRFPLVPILDSSSRCKKDAESSGVDFQAIFSPTRLT